MSDPVFGQGYSARQIPLGNDEEGPVVAVLVHRESTGQGGARITSDGPTTAPSDGSSPSTDTREPSEPSAKPPVLLLHGWSDYALNKQLTEHLAARGHDVWALDYRKHGRALREHQTPTALHDLRDVDVELRAALAMIGTPPVLCAHSMGGLIAVDFAARFPHMVRGLILNSPWLEFYGGAAIRHLVAPVAETAARAHPSTTLAVHTGDVYARTLHADHGGPVRYDLRLKPPGGHPMPWRTLAAVLRAQGALRTVSPHIPVLLLRSKGSDFSPRLTERSRRRDTVIDVWASARAARRCVPHARTVVLDGAVHDIFLSAPDVRERAYAALDTFLG